MCCTQCSVGRITSAHPLAPLWNTVVVAIWSSFQRRMTYVTPCQSCLFRVPTTPVCSRSAKFLHGVKAFNCVNCLQTHLCGNWTPQLISVSGSIQLTQHTSPSYAITASCSDGRSWSLTSTNIQSHIGHNKCHAISCLPAARTPRRTNTTHAIDWKNMFAVQERVSAPHVPMEVRHCATPIGSRSGLQPSLSSCSVDILKQSSSCLWLFHDNGRFYVQLTDKILGQHDRHKYLYDNEIYVLSVLLKI